MKPVDTAPVPPSNADSQPSNPIEDPQPVLSEQPKIPSEPAATDKPVPPIDDTDNKADQPDSPTASPVESEKTVKFIVWVVFSLSIGHSCARTDDVSEISERKKKTGLGKNAIGRKGSLVRAAEFDDVCELHKL